MSVLLQKPVYEGISNKELAAQLEARKKCEKKLPTWYNSPGIYFPNKLNIEQTSSERTASYKAGLVHGKSLADLTGGLGVDSYFFSRKIPSVTHVEKDPELSVIATHNFQILGRSNIHSVSGNFVGFLQNTEQHFSWIYLDPSRRNDHKGKVFRLADCSPNVLEHLELLFSKTDNILIKTAPLLDLKAGMGEMKFVKEIHIVAVSNEVKEVLWWLEKDFHGEASIKTVNLGSVEDEIFEFDMEGEQQASVAYGLPLAYLYEPNAAIMKSGGFKSIGSQYQLKKLHPNTHLYTSEQRIDFPGRIFRVESAIPYRKSGMKTLADTKANVATRNFPETVATIRKKHRIKDGGDTYLFFIRSILEKPIVLVCTKV
ncbi:MAG: class I SAM-dependent methyltransferase [Flavobacteriaceae bacterium]